MRATLDVLRVLLARYPEFATLSPAERYDWQREAHRKWAESFNDWLRRHGRTTNLADTQCP
ncbi:hypothetical protein [Buchananella felis]|uniref:hypothetical protein n=1 Tax=Buchananella felis TaxID=3231492 RepID=UPI003528EDCD